MPYYLAPSLVPSCKEEPKLLFPTRVLLDLLNTLVVKAKFEPHLTVREFLGMYREQLLFHHTFDEKLTLEEVLEWMEGDKSSHDFWEDIHCHAVKEADGFKTVQFINERLEQYEVSL